MVFVGGDRAMGGAPGADAASTMRFALHVMRGRWFMFFASILIMAAAGGTYIFGIYSKAIKTSLGYDQQTLNTLSFFKDVGANVGILPGLINEVTPPWVVLLCGAGMNLVGYLMIYLAITGRTAQPPVWLMCVYIAVGANSQSFANTGSLVTAVKNFPEDRGVVLGLLKGFVGLSGAIFTQLYRAIYGTDNDGADLVLLMAWLPAAISLVFIPTIRIMPRPRDAAAAERGERRQRERKAFFLFLYASIVLAAYLLVMNVVELEVIHFPKTAYYVTAVVLLLLIFFPIVIVVKQELKTYLAAPPATATTSSATIVTITVDDEKTRASNNNVAPESSSPDHRRGHHPAAVAAEAEDISRRSPSCFQDVFRPPARGQDYTILQALFSVDMLVLFVATICGVGGTLTAVDNLGQIGQSLGYPQRTISTFVSLVSIWNYAGRVVSGFASEYVLARYKVPRPLALTVVLLLACVGHALSWRSRAVRGVRDPGLLLRRAVAAAVRHHLRGVRAQVLLHALQLRLRGQPRGILHPQRPRRRPHVRPGGAPAGGRAAGQQGPHLHRRALLQGVVPHHHRRHAAGRARVAGAGLEDQELLPRRPVRPVQGGRHGRRSSSSRGRKGARGRGE